MNHMPFKGLARIYTLSDADGNVFYVGCTTRTLDHRLKTHISEATSNRPYSNTYKNSRIRALDFEVFIKEIDTQEVCAKKAYQANYQAVPLEKKWIDKFISLGAQLTNKIVARKMDPSFKRRARTKQRDWTAFTTK